MSKNVGHLDRIVRVIIGLGLLSLVFVLEGTVRWFGLIGLVLLVTGVMSYCPAYGLFGLRTCPLSPAHQRN